MKAISNNLTVSEQLKKYNDLLAAAAVLFESKYHRYDEHDLTDVIKMVELLENSAGLKCGYSDYRRLTDFEIIDSEQYCVFLLIHGKHALSGS